MPSERTRKKTYIQRYKRYQDIDVFLSWRLRPKRIQNLSSCRFPWSPTTDSSVIQELENSEWLQLQTSFQCFLCVCVTSCIMVMVSLFCNRNLGSTYYHYNVNDIAISTPLAYDKNLKQWQVLLLLSYLNFLYYIDWSFTIFSVNQCTIYNYNPHYTPWKMAYHWQYY